MLGAPRGAEPLSARARSLGFVELTSTLSLQLVGCRPRVHSLKWLALFGLTTTLNTAAYSSVKDDARFRLAAFDRREAPRLERLRTAFALQLSLVAAEAVRRLERRERQVSGPLEWMPPLVAAHVRSVLAAGGHAQEDVSGVHIPQGRGRGGVSGGVGVCADGPGRRGVAGGAGEVFDLVVEEVARGGRLDVVAVDRASSDGSLACPGRRDADGGGIARVAAGLGGQASAVHGCARQMRCVDGEREAAEHVSRGHGLADEETVGVKGVHSLEDSNLLATSWVPDGGD